MDRQQPTPKTSDLLLRTSSAVIALLAAHIGSAWPACAASHPPAGDDAPAVIQREAAAPPDSAARIALRHLGDAVRDHAARVSAETCLSADAMFDANAKRVDAAAAKGRKRVARRLGREFGMSMQALRDERSRLGVTWGELVIAHTLSASTEPRVPAELLVALHRSGLDWGQLAAGLGLDLADAVGAVNTEARVATGALPADGRVAPIRNDGSRPGPGV